MKQQSSSSTDVKPDTSQRPKSNSDSDENGSFDLIGALANHRTAPNLIMIVMVIGGLWALSKINFQLLPEIVINYVRVDAAWPGASPTDVDEGLVDDLVPAVQALENVDVTSSFAVQDGLILALELSESADQDAVSAKVQTAVDAVALPSDVTDPKVSTFIGDEPVVRLLISAPFDQVDLLRTATQIKNGLAQLGVSKVGIQGVRNPIIRVEPNEIALRELGISQQSISRLIGQHTQNSPSGSLGDGGATVRSLARANSLSQVVDIAVKTNPDGSVIRLGDVARVEQIVPDSGAEVRRNFNRSIEIVVSRAKGESTLKIQDIVTAYVDGVSGRPKQASGLFGSRLFEPARVVAAWELGAQSVLPSSVRVEPYDIAANFIRDRLRLLVENGALGLLIVLVMLAVFLNLRTAFWVAVGIPVSFAATFLVMYLTGQSLNFLSTFGLLITLGIIVDDAIVVGEHADELAGGDARRRVDQKFRWPVFVGGLLFCFFLMCMVFVAVMAGVPNAKHWPVVGGWVAPLQENLLVLMLTLAFGMFLSVAAAGVRLAREFPTAPLSGMLPRHAAVLAARRMAAPVTAAAITTLISFAVLVLIGGRLASFIAAIPLAVMAVLVASLLECFFVLPGHMRHALEARARERDRWISAPLRFFRVGFDWMFDSFRYGLFSTLVAGALRARYLVIGIAIASFVFALGKVITQEVRFEFFSSPSNGTIGIDFEMIDSASRDDTRAHIDNIQRAVETAFENSGVTALSYDDAVDMVVGRVGVQTQSDPFAQDVDPDRVGSVSVYILDPFQDALEDQIKTLGGDDALQDPSDYFGDLIKQATPVNPRLASQTTRSGEVSSSGGQVDIRLLDAEPQVLKAAALALAERLEALSGVSGVSDDMGYGAAEIAMTLNNRALSLGINSSDLSSQVRTALSQDRVYSINENGIDVGVVVTQPKAKQTREMLDDLPILIPTGQFVALHQLVEFSEQRGFDLIQREQNRRQVSVTAQLGANSALSSRDLAEVLKNQVLPEIQAKHAVNSQLAGTFVDEQEFFVQAAVSALLALVAIYLVLAWVFSSFWRPLAIMAIIPMGFVGTIYGHAIHDVNLTMLSVVGFMGLSGIIVNDSIVLISTIDRRAKSQSIWQAAKSASVDRLRAVLLTSVTTIGGLLPLVFEPSTQAEILLPTTLTLVYGLGLGTFWVLFLVPALVGVQADIGSCLTSARRFVRYLLTRRTKPLGRKAATLPIAPWQNT